MKKIIIQGINLKVSRLSFGTASLHHLFSPQKRDYLINTAIDHGISHFDTSPYYGYGVAEKQIGLLENHIKHNLTIATKIGIYPPRISGSFMPTWSIKVLGKINNNITKPIIDFSITRSEKSLNESLKRLKRDHVDILFLHEPSKALINTHEYLMWQEHITKLGKVANFGLAGPADGFADLLSLSPISRVLQVKDSLSKEEANQVQKKGRDLQFTYGYFSSSDRNSKHFSPEDTLKAALQRNLHGSIVVSTRKVERIKTFSNTVNHVKDK